MLRCSKPRRDVLIDIQLSFFSVNAYSSQWYICFVSCTFFISKKKKSIKNSPVIVDNVWISIRIYFDSLASKWIFFLSNGNKITSVLIVLPFYFECMYCSFGSSWNSLLWDMERSSKYKFLVTMSLYILGTDWFLGIGQQRLSV